MTWLLVFVAMFALDFVWARYTAGVAEKNPLAAANGAAIITLLGGYATTLYVENKWLLIPAVLGAYAGTFIAVGGHMTIPELLRRYVGTPEEVPTVCHSGLDDGDGHRNGG